jgi:hypothetical protein
MSTDCYTTSWEYIGHAASTVSGLRCIRWDSLTPQTAVPQALVPSNYPDASIKDAASFCRDVEHRGFPWCYTGTGTRERCRARPCSGFVWHDNHLISLRSWLCMYVHMYLCEFAFSYKSRPNSYSNIEGESSDYRDCLCSRAKQSRANANATTMYFECTRVYQYVCCVLA